MIKFFKHIRKSLLEQGRMGKYFKYAFGEIILVVIGILIALQINNANEDRKGRKQEQALYVKLLDNLNNDLDLIQETDSLLKIHDDIHYNLYNTKIGKDTFNADMHYGMLRWSIPFDPTFKGNYQDKLDMISNDEVRDAMSEYFRKEEITKTVISFFETLKADVVRPYITSNNLMNLTNVYVEKKYQEIDTQNSIEYDKLLKHLNTSEFEQILYELRIKTSAGFQNLKTLTSGNIKLKKIIKTHLIND